jgi:hypothetical protein
MAISRRENPSVFVRALTFAGLCEIDGREGWRILVHPGRPGVIVAVPTVQPLDARKIEGYLDAAGISESEYLAGLERALKEPPD